MSDEFLIRKIEEMSMNALPALETVFYDGWVLRTSNCYTKRANSIHPIYPSTVDIHHKMKIIEQKYLARNLRILYKMTDAVFPRDLDSILEKHNYSKGAETSVQVVELKGLIEKPTWIVEHDQEMNEEWFSSFCLLNKMAHEHQSTLREMLESISTTTCFMLMKGENNEIIACGLGVLEQNYLGLFDIVTNEKYRNLGYGTKLVKSLLDWGIDNGAEYAYLQVELKNLPALRLYSKLGFKEKYRYWYRMKQK